VLSLGRARRELATIGGPIARTIPAIGPTSCPCGLARRELATIGDPIACALPVIGPILR